MKRIIISLVCYTLASSASSVWYDPRTWFESEPMVEERHVEKTKTVDGQVVKKVDKTTVAY